MAVRASPTNHLSSDLQCQPSELPGGFVELRTALLQPLFLTEWTWNRTLGFTFRTNAQQMLMLLDFGSCCFLTCTLASLGSFQ